MNIFAGKKMPAETKGKLIEDVEDQRPRIIRRLKGDD